MNDTYYLTIDGASPIEFRDANLTLALLVRCLSDGEYRLYRPDDTRVVAFYVDDGATYDRDGDRPISIEDFEPANRP